MKYVALLRGINVGGNSIVKMADLRALFESIGYTNVSTYINSGNVLFESDEKEHDKLVLHIEAALEKTFHMPLKIVVRNHDEFKKVLSEAPASWKKETNIRCYVGFVREPMETAGIVDQFTLNKEVDSLDAGKHVVYMTTKMEGLTRSGFTKMIGTKIFKEITIRNLNTTKKLLSIMGE